MAASRCALEELADGSVRVKVLDASSVLVELADASAARVKVLDASSGPVELADASARVKVLDASPAADAAGGWVTTSVSTVIRSNLSRHAAE